MFAQTLLQWHRHHGRHDLPWQGTRDPYPIWVSEIMLQQTQVTTVIPYYRRFMLRFPTATALAAATQDELLDCGTGLGYYARARNLHRAARRVVDELGGRFPDQFDQVLDLPRGARRIASSAHCPVAALAVGDHLLGIQAHPEFDATYAGVLYRGRYSSSGVPGVLDDALATLDAPLHRVEVAEWMLRFLRGDTVQSASRVD